LIRDARKPRCLEKMVDRRDGELKTLVVGFQSLPFSHPITGLV